MTIAVFTVLGILYALTFRVSGGGLIKIKKPNGEQHGLFGLPEVVIALPFGIIAWLVTQNYVLWFQVFAVLSSFLIALLGKRLGHGQYFDLSRAIVITTAEKIDGIVSLFFGKDPNETQTGRGIWLRDFIGLTLTGFVMSLGITPILLMTGHYWMALFIYIACMMKGIVYEVGWQIHEKTKFKGYPTEIGEYLKGTVMALCLFPMIYMLV